MAKDKITELAKRLEPLLLKNAQGVVNNNPPLEGPGIDIVGFQVGLGGDKILLYKSNGDPVAEYAATDAGFTAALAAAVSGDVITIPACTIAGNHTIPNGITVWGFGWNSILSGITTNNGVLMYCHITGTLNNGDLGAAYYMADIPVAGHDVQRTIVLSSEGYDPGSTISVIGTGVTGTEGGAYLDAKGKFEAAVELWCTDSAVNKQFYRWNSIDDVLKAQLIDETTATVIRDLLFIDSNGNLTVNGGIANLPWYDAKYDGKLNGDGLTDDTTLLQTLINTATENGTRSATIYFPPGVYLIGGALQDTSHFNSQILLPIIAMTSKQITLRFIGSARPPINWLNNAGMPDPGGYSILKSTLTGGTGTAAFFSAGDLQNNLSTVWENLLFCVPDNPTFTCLSLEKSQGGSLRGIQIATPGGWGGSLVQPTHSNAYGVKLPEVLNSNYTETEALSIGEYYTCLLDGELAIHKGLVLGNCIVCIEEPAIYYQSVILNVQMTGFQYGIKGTGIHYLDVINYCAEHSTSPAWRVTVTDIEDPSNYLHGHIRWMNAATGGTADHSFTKNGGTGIFSEEMIDLLPDSGVTPATYGDGTHVSQITVDKYGRITTATDVDISAVGGVTSLAKQGKSELTGDITLSEGDGVTLVQAGNNIEINATGVGELLMQDGVSSPPVPVETEDGTDWLYQG